MRMTSMPSDWLRTDQSTSKRCSRWSTTPALLDFINFSEHGYRIDDPACHRCRSAWRLYRRGECSSLRPAQRDHGSRVDTRKVDGAQVVVRGARDARERPRPASPRPTGVGGHRAQRHCSMTPQTRSSLLRAERRRRPGGSGDQRGCTARSSAGSRPSHTNIAVSTAAFLGVQLPDSPEPFRIMSEHILSWSDPWRTRASRAAAEISAPSAPLPDASRTDADSRWLRSTGRHRRLYCRRALSPPRAGPGRLRRRWSAVFGGIGPTPEEWRDLQLAALAHSSLALG